MTALFGKADTAWFDALRRAHYPPQRNQLQAHLTMFHHLAPSLSEELKHRLAEETHRVRPPSARLAGLVSLGQGTAFRVESPGLADIRDRLADAFAPMLMPQDSAGWRPHVTIQNKVAPAEAKALLQRLQADFTPRPVAIAGLASWWYRGGPWEEIASYKFK